MLWLLGFNVKALGFSMININDDDDNNNNLITMLGIRMC